MDMAFGNAEALLQAVNFDDNGLVPVIAQQYDTGDVLMLAWMNKQSLLETLATGRTGYWFTQLRKHSSVAIGKFVFEAHSAAADKRLRWSISSNRHVAVTICTIGPRSSAG
ncbi:MAG: hypothetical protein AAFV69_04425 [Pseudomonadota bacterium]